MVKIDIIHSLLHYMTQLTYTDKGDIVDFTIGSIVIGMSDQLCGLNNVFVHAIQEIGRTVSDTEAPRIIPIFANYIFEVTIFGAQITCSILTN